MSDRKHSLEVYGVDAKACVRCHDHGLLYRDEVLGTARPILPNEPTGALGILFVGEAPNREDTYDLRKGYLTYGPDTDQTGRSVRTLLIDEVGLRPEEVYDVLFTNAVLCLPAGEKGKYEVTPRQMELCRPWLVRLIEDAQPGVVVAMGGKALKALGQIERHGLTLQKGVGRLHPWFGRSLLPLYHAGLLGQITRPQNQQRQDIRPLRAFLGR